MTTATDRGKREGAPRNKDLAILREYASIRAEQEPPPQPPAQAAQPPAEAQPVTGRLGLLALALALVGLLAGCASAPEPVAAPPLTSICLCGSIVHADGTRNDSFQSCFTSEVSFSDLRSITLHLCTADDLTKVLP